MFVNTLEILIMTTAIYYVLSFFWNSRTMDLIYGLLACFGIFFITQFFEFPVLQSLMYYLVNVAMVALVVIFQPELRLALSKLSVKGRKYREFTEFDKFLHNLSQCVYRLAERRVGALVVLENQDSLEEYVNKAVVINADFSAELLESIFSTTTPLHDGATIIGGTKILSAATILPLADDTAQLSKSMGTRHRAALGISQLTDALVIVISEESGRVSIARDGIMTRGIKMDRFKGILSSIFNPPQTDYERSFHPIERFKQWTKQWTN